MKVSMKNQKLVKELEQVNEKLRHAQIATRRMKRLVIFVVALLVATAAGVLAGAVPFLR